MQMQMSKRDYGEIYTILSVQTQIPLELLKIIAIFC